jgi:RND family efflux transporter MFP subunit
MNKKVWMGVSGAVLVLFTGWLIFRPNQDVKSTNAEALYDFTAAQRMDLSEKVDATGNVLLSKNADIYPAFDATVKQIYCKAGDYVKKGRLLISLDSPQMAESYADALASASQAQVNLNTAIKNWDDTKALLAVQGATVTQENDARDKVNICQQQMQSARLKLDNILQRPDDANFIAANHREILIRAPFEGTIAWINVVTGAHVLPANILLSVAADDALEVEAQVDESEIQMVKPGQKAAITSNDPEQPDLEGVVIEVGTIGATVAGVVNFPVHVKVTGDNQILKAGMSVDITITAAEHPNALAIPVNAVVQRRGKSMVALKDKDSINYVRVETGVQTGTNIEIVSGLKEGDMVGIQRPKSNPQNMNNRSGGAFGFGRH